jgi:hypothetical protein
MIIIILVNMIRNFISCCFKSKKFKNKWIKYNKTKPTPSLMSYFDSYLLAFNEDKDEDDEDSEDDEEDLFSKKK